MRRVLEPRHLYVLLLVNLGVDRAYHGQRASAVTIGLDPLIATFLRSLVNDYFTWIPFLSLGFSSQIIVWPHNYLEIVYNISYYCIFIFLYCLLAISEIPPKSFLRFENDFVFHDSDFRAHKLSHDSSSFKLINQHY